MSRARNNKVINNKKTKVYSELPREIKEYPEFIEPKVKPIKGLTPNQREYLNLLKTKDIVFSTGYPGTGKTMMAMVYALEELVNHKKIDTIYLTRPAVSAGEDLGFLPGTLEEKFSVYIEPFIDVIEKSVGKGFAKYLINAGKIKGVPLAYLRSKTFENSICIADEMQNSTVEQMYLLLTRMGYNNRIFICGDTNQKDIKGSPGISDGLRLLYRLDEVGSIHFEQEDIVRSPLCKKIILAYNGVYES